jgi:hypothetical protein
MHDAEIRAHQAARVRTPARVRAAAPAVARRPAVARPAVGRRAVARRRARRRRATLPVAAASLVAALAAGCLDRDLRPIIPCVHQNVADTIQVDSVDKVDLLFLVDNSGSMAEEQASLADQLPRLVRILVTGDRDGDGVADFSPVRDLHVGVVSSDMGVAGFAVPTCGRNAMFGDDGVLLHRGSPSVAGCSSTYPRFLRYQPGISPLSPEEFGRAFACVATLGTSGCGFEQQLEAVLKAVTPSADTSITFMGRTLGHGDDPATNGGFVRPDSVLAIVLVTDEEDCSIRSDDPGAKGIFDLRSTVYTGDLNLRCHLYKEPQWPVQRYIDGLKKLRPRRESLVVFGAITGVPVDAVDTTPVDPAAPGPGPRRGACVRDDGTFDHACILADDRMVERVDTSATGAGARLVPSCDVPGRGVAFPPRRIVEAARGFGQNGVVQSICQADFGPALDAIIAKVIDALGNVCLPRALNRAADDRVDCDVVEILPRPGEVPGAPARCADVPGADPTPLRVDAHGRPVCKVAQLPVDAVVRASGAPPPGAGWYYDDYSAATDAACRGAGATAQRVAFTAEATPPPGVTVALECLQRLQGEGGATGGAAVGAFCDPDDARACGGASSLSRLACDALTRTCQRPCANDADCDPGFACDAAGPTAVCRDATCFETGPAMIRTSG